MKKRLITGVVMVAILLPLAIIKELLPVFQVICAFFVCVGAFEMLRLYETEKKYSWRVKAVVIFSTLLVFVSGLAISSDFTLISTVNPGTVLYFRVNSKVAMALFLIAVVLQLSLLVLSKSFDARDIGKTLSISFYVGLGVAAILAIRIMGVRYLIYLFLITTLTDIFAYVYGMLFGKHKMIERISPKKTWEGAIGGTVIATAMAGSFALLYGSLFQGIALFGNPPASITIFHEFAGFDIWQPVKVVIIYGVTLLASIVSQIGDLVASRLKRTYGVKDFGNIFPGHGGFLDRFDSSILTAMFLMAAFLLMAACLPPTM